MRGLLSPITFVLSFIARSMALGGAGLLAYHGYRWFMSGKWPRFSLNDFLWQLNWVIPGGVYEWLAEPTTISGVNKITVYALKMTPASAFLLVVGVLMAWVIAPLRQR